MENKKTTPSSLLYRSPAGEEELNKALRFCAGGIAGAEMYTFLRLEGVRLPQGRFFCAENEAGEVVSAVFFNGDLAVTKQAGAPPYPGLALMRFAGIIPPAGAGTAPMGLKETLFAYRALGDGTLTPANEARYVYRARALRDGLAAGACVQRAGAPAAFAFITAQNETDALIGDVFTLPAYRGRGYARACVTALVRAALQNEKTPWVLCEARMRGYYETMGFETDEQL